jgi:hypothetical protein
MATGKLLGRSSAGTGVAEEITIGSGLSLAAGTLTASGSAAGPVLQAAYVISENVTLSTNYHGLSLYSAEVASGYSVTVPSGAIWTIASF